MLTLCAAALLAAAPARAPDLGIIEARFEHVSAVTVYHQLGGVPLCDDVSRDGRCSARGRRS
jgi:ssDNA-binding replication factor A large subunit